VAAAAVAGLALLGPRITAANTGVCSVGEPEHVDWLCRKEWRFIGDSSPSSLRVLTAEARADWR
jgi:hypothetical protein